MTRALPQTEASSIYGELAAFLEAEHKLFDLTKLGNTGTRLLAQIRKLRKVDRYTADCYESVLLAGAGQTKAAIKALENARELGLPNSLFYTNLAQIHGLAGDFTAAQAAILEFLKMPTDVWAVDFVNHAGICELHNATIIPGVIEPFYRLVDEPLPLRKQERIDAILEAAKDMEALNISNKNLLDAYDLVGKTLRANGYLSSGYPCALEFDHEEQTAALNFFLPIPPGEAAKLDDALSDLVAATTDAIDNPILPFILSANRETGEPVGVSL